MLNFQILANSNYLLTCSGLPKSFQGPIKNVLDVSGRKGREIAIPEFLREQYFQQTGMEVSTTSFREPGMHTATANTVRSFPGRQAETFELGHTIFSFEFEPEAYTLISNDGDRETVQSAQLKVLWEPRLSIKRSHGSFKARVHDVIKKAKDFPDMQITMLLDTKRIYHRDADIDKGWYTFDVTPAVHR